MDPVLHRNDRELARRLSAGDDSAFQEFFSLYFARLYRFASARGRGDAALVEDVVSEALSTAILEIHGYRGEAALFTWLCTICRRLLIRREQAARHRVARLAYLEEDMDVRGVVESIATEIPEPEAALLARARGEAVHAALDALPERYARVLEWKYLEGETVKRIAERLGLGLKAAESTLTRARIAFRDVLGALEDGENARGRTAP